MSLIKAVGIAVSWEKKLHINTHRTHSLHL